jgi:hypothetical protein
MRRLLTITIVVATLIAAAPVFAGTSSQSPAALHLLSKTSKPVRETKHAKCKAPKKKGAKKTPKACAKPKKKKTTHHANPTTVPATRRTSTPTVTPSPTATDTSMPAPTASINTIGVRAVVNSLYQAAFFACGLPAGVSASFGPNPATSSSDKTLPTHASAPSTLSVSTAAQTQPGTYLIALYAYFKNAKGVPVLTVPAGGWVEPRTVLLTVDGSHATTITPSTAYPADLSVCSTPPAGFQPTPPATPSPADFQVQARLSDTTPHAGENVTIYGTLTASGQGIYNTPMDARWFLPNGIEDCYGITDAGGTASCTVTNSATIKGYQVEVEVIFQYAGHTYTDYATYAVG